MLFQKFKLLFCGQKSSRQTRATITSLFYLTVFSCLIPTDSAYAYLDPGTGSYVLQIIIGATFGAGYVIKVYFGQIVGFFKKLGSSKNKKNGLKDTE